MAAANGDPASNIMVYVIVEMKSEDGDFLSGVYQFISHRLSPVLSQQCVSVCISPFVSHIFSAVCISLYLIVCLPYFGSSMYQFISHRLSPVLSQRCVSVYISPFVSRTFSAVCISLSHHLSPIFSRRCVLVYLYLTVCLLYFPCRSPIVYSVLYSIRGLKEVFCVFVYY